MPDNRVKVSLFLSPNLKVHFDGCIRAYCRNTREHQSPVVTENEHANGSDTSQLLAKSVSFERIYLSRIDWDLQCYFIRFNLSVIRFVFTNRTDGGERSSQEHLVEWRLGDKWSWGSQFWELFVLGGKVWGGPFKCVMCRVIGAQTTTPRAVAVNPLKKYQRVLSE